MTQNRLTEHATFLLRLALGIMLIAHSWLLKLFVFTLPGTANFFQSLGLPSWSAYAVFAIEAVAGILLVLGIQSRWVALTVVPILAGATWAHWGNGWLFNNTNGGWEYPIYLTLLAFVQFLLGDGSFAVKRSAALPGLTGRDAEALS